MKMFNKITAIIILIVMAFVQAGYAYAADTEKRDPKLTIKTDGMVNADAGQKLELEITVSNDTDEPSKNIELEPQIDENFPFEITTSTVKKTLPRVGRYSSEAVMYEFMVPAGVKAGTYPVKFNVKYENFYSDRFEKPQTIYIKVKNEQVEPMLGVARTSFSGSKLQAGKSSQVSFFIKNTGGFTAKKIYATISGFQSEGLTMTGTNTVVIDSIKPGVEKPVSFDITPYEDIKSGNYSLTMKLEYTDENSRLYSKESNVFLPVSGADEREAYFEILEMDYPSGEVQAESDFTISFTLKNNGNGQAKKTKVSVDGGDQIVSKSMSVKNLGLMKPGDEKRLSFTMFADSGAKRKNHPIAINIEYEGEDKTKQTSSQSVGVFVEGGGEGRAKIIVEDYKFGGDYVKAGVPFDLKLTLTNTNSRESVEDVKVSLKSENGIFTPVGSSNSFVIDKLGPKQSMQKTIKLKSKPDAEHKSYEINVEMEYGADLEGEPYVSKEIITVPLIHETNLEISDIQLPPEVYIGRGNDIHVDFYNRGKSKMSNMMVTLEGDFEVQEGKYFVGDFQAGGSDYFEASIIPSEEGEFKGKIVFEFEDAIGEKKKVEREFTVMAVQPPIEGEEPVEEPGGGNSKKMIYGASAAVIAVLAAVFTMKKRKAKKAKESELDE